MLKMLSKNKNKIRCLFIIIGIVVVLLVAVGIIAKFWMIPTVIRKGIASEINKSWSGRVHIEGLKFYFKGHVILDKLLLQDDQGRDRIQLINIKADMEDISKLNFKVKKLEIGSAEVNMFPVVNESGIKRRSLSEYFARLNKGHFDIKQLSIENISVTLHNAGKEKVSYNNLSLHINKVDSLYKIAFTKPSDLESQLFKVEGSWDPNTENSYFELSLKRAFHSEEVAIIAGLLGFDTSYKAEGSLDGTIRFKQSLGELDLTSINGDIDFDNFKITKNENMLMQNLSAKVVLENNQCKVENLKADICQGTLEGDLVINNWWKRNEFFGTGKISGKKVNLSQLRKCTNLSQKLSKGTLRFEYNLVADTNNLGEMTGQGYAFINDSDLYQLPVISQIFFSAGFKVDGLQKATDGLVFFRNAGFVATINKGQVSNLLWAIRVEPGGTVDVHNKTVDMHVIVAPLSLIEDIVRKLPFAELFGKIKDKLTRLKVKGSWSDPTNKLVTKEPLTDIKEATVGFIRDVVESGGQITEIMYQPIKKMFDKKNIKRNDL